ncbi:MAG: cobalamin-dependent protein [Deltaproteobacteria bacterium]|nr:cobalamin-dependent protein [Deltaproteobacteria bacterium]MBW2119801.1 cobalamin-dependent protein [Deltaproteobacteria bacterium]MBW2344596.1 cobalamin-dependent protein [Deltaproteobacteria bacterium]
MARKIRVLISRLGLDAHWTGSTVIAKTLSNAGMEVIYGGSMFPEEIARTAQQENVDVVGLSTLSGNHLQLGPEVITELKSLGIKDDVFVLMGGAIPVRDVPVLKESGILEVFGTGTNTGEVVSFIEGRFK